MQSVSRNLRYYNHFNNGNADTSGITTSHNHCDNIALMATGLLGATGRRYIFKELIQERPNLGRVWLATSAYPFHLHHTTFELMVF